MSGGGDHDRGEENIDVVWIPKFIPGTFIWSPSPGFSIIVIEELHQAHHKRTKYAHVLVVPRIIRNEWRKHMHKSEDLILYIPAGRGYI